MKEEDYKQYLEDCLNQKQEIYSKEFHLFEQLLAHFEKELLEKYSERFYGLLGFFKKARVAKDEKLDEIKEEQQQNLKRVQNSTMRIGGAIFTLVLLHHFIYSPISYQFCKYNNIQSRTYEDKEQCR